MFPGKTAVLGFVIEMTAFLIAIRVSLQFCQTWRFSLVKTHRFESKSDVLKSMISQS